MKKLFSILLLILFCGFSYKKTNKQIDKDTFFIKDLNYRDFSLQKLMDIGFDGELALLYRFRDDTIPVKLNLVDSLDYIYVKERQRCLSSTYYYYSIINTINYYSYVYYYFNEAKQTAFVLVNYDKKGKYIDNVIISSLSGDGGYFEHSEGIFVNDSVIVRTDTKGEYDAYLQDAKDTITSLDKYKILLKKDGHIQINTLTINNK